MLKNNIAVRIRVDDNKFFRQKCFFLFTMIKFKSIFEALYLRNLHLFIFEMLVLVQKQLTLFHCETFPVIISVYKY